MNQLNAANRKDVRRAEKASAVADRQRLDNLRLLMSTPGGRLYIWGELSAAHIFQTSFAPDPIQMAFLEGERNMGLRLLNDILEADADQFIILWREQRAREYTNEQSRGSQSDGGDSESGPGDRDTYYDTGDGDSPVDYDTSN